MLTPQEPRDPERVKALCAQLQEGTSLKKAGKCIKFSNEVRNTNQVIDSWKFNEFDYARNSVQLPIRARGLFTINDNEIVVRGYDKFFNVDEVADTKLKTLPESTVGPYDVTLKENGCIILIGGLKTGDIVVCSKHSTGVRESTTRDHAFAGETSLRQQIAKLASDKTVEEMAKYLYANNLTAVAEFCDDEFEEHVLPYDKERSGLYLHGLNYNTIEFKTVPIEEVTQFAHNWGFKTIDSLQFARIDELFEFLDECAKTGTYNGRESEGFVIRCHHPDGSDFFFKYKFEQPYLLYRQFREVTRKIFVEGQDEADVFVKTQRMITSHYIAFVRRLFQDQPHLLKEFAEGHGIIKIRQLFLQDLNESNGMNLISLDKTMTDNEMSKLFSKLGSDETVKYVLVSIATPGCGKTTVYLTLQNLFPLWLHLQNDNFQKGRFKIIDSCLQGLSRSPLVMFDRNNSEKRERQQIFDDFARRKLEFLDSHQEVKFVAINYVNDIDDATLQDITLKRITQRGDNHQSIKAAADPEKAKGIATGFIKRLQPVSPESSPDNLFDSIINVDVSDKEDSSLDNVKKIIVHLKLKYPKLITTQPTEEEINIAYQKARNYKPKFTKIISNKPKNVSYFGVSIPSDYISGALNILRDHPQWRLLQQSNRVQKSFHITLGHSASLKADNNLRPTWKEFSRVFQPSYDNKNVSHVKFYASVKLIKIVINYEKLICITAEIIDYFKDSEEKIPKLKTMNKFLHITVGTMSPEIKPRESNETLVKLYDVYNKGSTQLYDGQYTMENGEIIEVISLPKNTIIEGARIFASYI
ncbi:RNA ligase-domain-containing protein [Scheffersomyces xylosifermentans]|uniref:RNA ligase-domain-containing protein n=1 Tax=Scheffersomyces xylosifermentans TaxID=1304137 RepID=UPI00315DD3FB